ncbi:hypothetical protein GF314_15600 [bacterium]|nr:hypothetical protein [bacterium]
MSMDREEFGARLEAYLGGDLDPDQRAAFEAEVLDDPDLAEQFAATVGQDAAVREAQVVEGSHARDRLVPRRVWPVAMAAAAAVAVLVFWPGGVDLPTEAPERVLRSGADAVRPLEPRGTVSGEIERFRWTSVPGAVRYRLEVRDLDGRVRHVALVGDTVLTRAAATFPVVVDSLAGGLAWQVVPVLVDGRRGEASPTAAVDRPR